MNEWMNGAHPHTKWLAWNLAQSKSPLGLIICLLLSLTHLLPTWDSMKMSSSGKGTLKAGRGNKVGCVIEMPSSDWLTRRRREGMSRERKNLPMRRNPVCGSLFMKGSALERSFLVEPSKDKVVTSRIFFCALSLFPPQNHHCLPKLSSSSPSFSHA